MSTTTPAVGMRRVMTRAMTLIAGVVTLTLTSLAIVPAADAATPGTTTAPRATCGQLTDVAADNTFCGNITFLTAHGVTPTASTYRPTAPITRGTMAAFLYRMMHPGENAPSCDSEPFSDVPQSGRYCGYIDWAVHHGITNGYRDGTYGTDTPVSRQAMAAFFYRIVHSGDHAGSCSSSPYPDVAPGSSFCGAITWLKHSGITHGNTDDTYGSTRPVSRQAMAAFVARTMHQFLGVAEGPGDHTAARAACQAPVDGTFDHDAEAAVVAALNEERAAHGLDALTVDCDLYASAARHDVRMAKNQNLAHVLPGEDIPMVRMEAEGADRYQSYGENIGYYGAATLDPTAFAVKLNTMMYQEQPPNDGHRQNILRDSFDHVGVAVHVDSTHHRVWLSTDFAGNAVR